jgi:hypothetical protein
MLEFRDAFARDGKHFGAHIHAHGVFHIRGEQFEHLAGAGARIEQVRNRRAGNQAHDGAIDFGIGGMQRADARPLIGIGFEKGRRPRRAAPADGREILEIGGKRGGRGR